MIMEAIGIGNNDIEKIFYISDWDVNPGFYKFDRHRFPQAYIELAPWYILNWRDIPYEIKGNNNTIIFNTPVHDELNKLNIIDSLIENNKVYIVQEGTAWDWCDWPAKEQELYIKILSKSKGFLYSNEYDKKMMRAFVDNFIKVPPCSNHFLENARDHLGEFVFLVNPSKRYQRGMLSHKLVYDSVPKDIPVYTVVYNRPKLFNELLSFPDAYKMPGFKQIDYMPHDEFMSTVYNSRFGVDICRDFTAGTISIDFASLSVPLVGNIELDPQREIFPDTSFEWSDYDNIKKCIHLLSVDDDFCKEVGEKALKNAKEKYSSNIIIEQYIKDFNNLKNKI
jgi:hypothetical protein